VCEVGEAGKYSKASKAPNPLVVDVVYNIDRFNEEESDKQDDGHIIDKD
jgi:hypothetical protein